MQQRELLTKLFENRIGYSKPSQSQFPSRLRDSKTPDQILTSKNEFCVSNEEDGQNKSLDYFSEREAAKDLEAETFEFFEIMQKDFSRENEDSSGDDIFREHERANAKQRSESNAFAKLEGKNLVWHEEDSFQSSEEESFDEDSQNDSEC